MQYRNNLDPEKDQLKSCVSKGLSVTDMKCIREIYNQVKAQLDNSNWWILHTSRERYNSSVWYFRSPIFNEHQMWSVGLSSLRPSQNERHLQTTLDLDSNLTEICSHGSKRQWFIIVSENELLSNQWWPNLLTHLCVSRPQWVKSIWMIIIGRMLWNDNFIFT